MRRSVNNPRNPCFPTTPVQLLKRRRVVAHQAPHTVAPQGARECERGVGADIGRQEVEERPPVEPEQGSAGEREDRTRNGQRGGGCIRRDENQRCPGVAAQQFDRLADALPRKVGPQRRPGGRHVPTDQYGGQERQLEEGTGASAGPVFFVYLSHWMILLSSLPDVVSSRERMYSPAARFTPSTMVG